MKTRIGTSGAIITLGKMIVTKRERRMPGRMRVAEQGRYMREHKDSVFPHVFECGTDHYVMEKLKDVKFDAHADALKMCNDVLMFLGWHLWGALVEVDLRSMITDEHVTYVQARSGPFHDIMERWLYSLLDEKVIACDAIHGDPTLDNVMARDDGRILLIDPIPANAVIPRIIEVDVAKVMQSVWGYESMIGKYPFKPPDHPARSCVSLSSAPANMRVSEYFLACHIARLIPYRPDGHKRAFWDLLERIITVYAA